MLKNTIYNKIVLATDALEQFFKNLSFKHNFNTFFNNFNLGYNALKGITVLVFIATFTHTVTFLFIGTFLEHMDFVQSSLLDRFSWVVWLPLFSAIICGFFGRFVGSLGSMLLSTVFIGLSAVLSIIAFFQVGLLGEFFNIEIVEWIKVNTLIISWNLRFDALSVIMLLIVNIVSWLVHIYSIGYMSEDPHVPRFMSYLSLFTFFMNTLVTANNFVQLFFGWEGVGLCSYLLISFWFTRVQAVKAAFKAVIVNKIGDVFFLLSMMIIFTNFNTFNFSNIFALAPYLKNEYFIFFSFNCSVLEFACFFLMLAAMAKSAQFGLHTWLADAMEGPTPVSALIHAATMVTAGIFLVIRCSPIFEYTTYTLEIMTLVGSITAFVGASIALVQYDVKKIIAFSTMSQLGYMFFACGLSAYNLSLYHLFNHAFFKALLFLSAGSLIHSLSDEQDIRKMGGLLKILPITYICFLVGSLSLIGFPFTSGFFSKELILNQAFAKNTTISFFAYFLGLITAALTTFYSVRLIWWVFLSKYNGYKSVIVKVKESDGFMYVPMIILAFCTTFSGYLFKDIFSGKGSTFFKNSIFIHKDHILDNELIPLFFKLLPIFLVVFQIILALHCSVLNSYFSNFKFYKNYGEIHQFLFNRYHVDTLYNKVAYNFLEHCFLLYKIIDQGIIEMFGPGLLRLIFSKISYYWKLNVANNNTIMYLQWFSIVISLILIVFFFNYLYF